ncbi:sugar phosphate nucleotidyltransferase [Actinoplanes campanulatus]|uniref:sugar phosphate nucleotidyltransferase n=1 Tax=Actinoplanes campanulatus TaxID=113559 RepID=UPI003571270B
MPSASSPSPAPASTAARAPVPVCGVVLAAGEGQRLRPLTETLPKALCPVGNLPLLDHALRRFAGLGLSGPDTVAVNAAYLAAQVVAHVGRRAHLSVEPDGPIGTSGGIGRLRPWIDGRAVLAGNADAYLHDPVRDPGKDVAALLDGWSGETVRMLTMPCRPGESGGFSGHRFAGLSLIPWRYAKDLADVDSSLVRTVWRPAEAAGELELIGYQGFYLDTGTPADYLAANLHAARGVTLADVSARVTGAATESVLGAGSVVEGSVVRSVLWPGAHVAPGEHLVGAVRTAAGLTVHA